MNIYAKSGHKVIVTEATKKNGYSYHKELVEKHLKIGVPYEVQKTDVGNWHTDVFLVGFTGIAFNSVSFEDYEPLSVPVNVSLINEADNSEATDNEHLKAVPVKGEEKQEQPKLSVEELFRNFIRQEHLTDKWEKYLSSHATNDANMVPLDKVVGALNGEQIRIKNLPNMQYMEKVYAHSLINDLITQIENLTKE